MLFDYNISGKKTAMKIYKAFSPMIVLPQLEVIKIEKNMLKDLFRKTLEAQTMPFNFRLGNWSIVAANATIDPLVKSWYGVEELFSKKNC